MLSVLLVVNLVVVVLLVVLLLRKQAPQAVAVDPKLGEQMTRVDVRTETLDRHVQMQLDSIGQKLSSFTSDANQQQTNLREALNSKLQELMRTNSAGLEKLNTDNSKKLDEMRQTVDEKLHATLQTLQELMRANSAGLEKLNVDNSKKLEEMRQTVDEKLHATLQTRLTESFGQVTDQLTKVHAGLGEMNTLATGVNDLNRIFSNVKTRGGFAEVQLGKLLEQVLAPGQYVQNAHIKPNSLEVVEYAVRFPGAADEVLLPIDAKFPREAWERLETAYETGTAEQIEVARRAFDTAIRIEGKRICEKYIHEPVTTPYAIMFLPTESLYSEVLRRDGLQSELHQNCRVMVAGPTNLYALLTSFQVGFKMLNLQKKGNEVWQVLGAAQSEFGKFGDLMVSMEKQVGTVQNTIQKLGVRTRAIQKTLRDVGEVDPGDAKVLHLEEMLPQLGVGEEE